MLSKLTDSKYQSQYKRRAASYSYIECINWGKACTTPEGVEIMQGGVTCKDYVVDTLFKETLTFNSSYWTKKEREECCFYISFPTNQYAVNFEKNVNGFLNAYEKSYRLKKTIITPTTTGHGFQGITYTIKGSQKWMTNAFVMSMYLSLIRVCACKVNMTEVSFVRDKEDFGCNENIYWGNLQDTHRTLLLKYYANIRDFMKPLPGEYGITGYKKDQEASHGQCGLFYILSMVLTYKHNPHTTYARPFLHNIFGAQIWKDLHGGAEFTPAKNQKKDTW